MTKVIVRISGSKREANKEIIANFLQVIRGGIVNDMSANNRNSSRKFIRSLSIVSLNNGGQLVGEDYAQQLVAGRKPGKFPPIKSIRQWIDDKGLSPQGITKDSLAFLIARKIAKSGTDIFRKKRPELDVKGIVERAEPQLKDQLIKAGKIEIKSAIAKALSKSPNLKLQP